MCPLLLGGCKVYGAIGIEVFAKRDSSHSRDDMAENIDWHEILSQILVKAFMGFYLQTTISARHDVTAQQGSGSRGRVTGTYRAGNYRLAVHLSQFRDI